jgi:D-sedoheptulose 7-phosphate isomerase
MPPAPRAPGHPKGGAVRESARGHLDALAEALQRLDHACLARWGARLAVALGDGARLLAVGNGGSAAQAQHLTAELVGRYRDDRPPFSALALCGEGPALTAIANDYGVEQIFARQVAGHGRAGDVLIALSTSGRSPNVLMAADRAMDLGMTVWGLTGPGPNPLSERCDECVCVESPFTATVQEVHLIAVHLLCAAFDTALLRTAMAR